MSERAGTAERVARNAFLKAAVQATRLLSLVFTVVAARILGPEDFGRFTFAYTLASLLGAALDLGMHSILVRSIARAREDTAAYWAAAVTLKLTLLLPVGVVFTALPAVMHRPVETAVAVWILCAAIAFQSFLELAVSVFTGHERLEFELGVRIVEKVVLVGIGTTALALGGRLFAVTGAFAAAALASLVLGSLLVHRRFARLRWHWDASGARGLARAVGPVSVAFLLGVAASRIPTLLVSLLAGDVAAGHFGAAVRVLDVVAVLPVAAVAGSYPVLSRLGPADPRFRRVVVQVVSVLLMLGLAVGLALAQGGPWLVTTVYGARYEPTGALLTVLSAAAALYFVAQFLGTVLIAIDRPGRLVAVGAISLGACLLLTPALIVGLGAMGGAVGLVLVGLVEATGCLVALLPFIRLPFDRAALKMGAAALVAWLCAGLLPAGSGGRMVTALVVYAVALLALRPVPWAMWSRLLRGMVGGGPGPGPAR